MIKRYGKIKEEDRLEQSIVSREIVKTIRDYGVSQYQIIKIIYLLSMEIEDRQLSDDFGVISKSALDDLKDEESNPDETKIITK